MTVQARRTIPLPCLLLLLLLLSLAPASCAAPCGDGSIDEGEECDGDSLASWALPCPHMVCDDCERSTHCWAVWPTCNDRCELRREECPDVCTVGVKGDM
jgi:hypothetical protein